MAMLASIIHFRKHEDLLAPVVVLTVDHGLRSESVDEAKAVQAYCKKYHISHEILTWSGPTPTSAIAESAREIRRQLLLQACNASGIEQMILAHTMDDVAETLLMRVRRGGLRGHASIPLRTRMSSVHLFRPFLNVRRNMLRHALQEEGVDWVDDPTNDNLLYERPRVRTMLRSLEQTEYTIEKISSYADVMSRWRRIIAVQISRILLEGCEAKVSDLHIKASVFERFPKMVGVETLRELVRFVGGDAHMINRGQASLAWNSLLSMPGSSKRFSVGRCVLSPQMNGTWILSRAMRALPTQQIFKGQTVYWDGRFLVQNLGEVSETATISPHRNLPKIVPDNAQCEVTFHPRVMNGPISCLDEAIFTSFSALLGQAN